MWAAIAAYGAGTRHLEGNVGLGVYVLLVAILIALGCAMAWASVSSTRDDGPGDNEPPRGGGAEPDPSPPDTSPSSDPARWPDFERQLEACLKGGAARPDRLTSPAATR